jgi:hypothetical protein
VAQIGNKVCKPRYLKFRNGRKRKKSAEKIVKTEEGAGWFRNAFATDKYETVDKKYSVKHKVLKVHIWKNLFKIHIS